MSPLFEVPLHLLLALLPVLGGQAPASDELRSPTGRSAHTLPLTDEAWLAALHRHGSAARLEGLNRRIFVTSSGHHYAPVAQERRALLALKGDPAVAVVVGLAMARSDAQVVRNVLGREATAGELLLAHLTDVRTAITLADAAEAAAMEPAAAVAPAAALRHPELFFAGRRVRTAKEVLTAADEAVARGRRGSVTAKLSRGRGSGSTLASH